MPIDKQKIILINGRDLAKKAGGTKVYLEYLLNSVDILLAKNKDLKIYVLTGKISKIKYKNINIIESTISNPILFDIFIIGYFAIKFNADVIVGTKYITPPILTKKRISFIYDMGYFYKEHYYSLKEKLRMRVLLWFGRLFITHYVTISHYTKMDIQNNLYLSPKKISIMYPGSDHLKDIVSQKPHKFLPSEYMLFTGSNSYRKNLDRLIEAYKQSKIKTPLLITGYNYPEVNNRQKIRSCGKIIHLGYVSDSELKFLYENATTFIYPSLFEGFGLPIVEAQSLGIPVITSNNSSMPEAGGDAALYIDPHLTQDLSKAIQSIVRNKKLRKELIKKGRLHAKHFSWEKTAKKFINLCKTI